MTNETVDKLPERIVIDRQGSLAEVISARGRNPITPDTDRQLLRAIVKRYNAHLTLVAALRRISNGNDTATMREWASDALESVRL